MNPLSLLLVGWTLFSQTAKPETPPSWADPRGPILAQPFEKQPFYAVKVPSWVGQTMGAGYTLSAMSSESRAAAAKHGVTLSEMGFVDPFYAYYDSALLKKRSPHVPLDRLPKDIAEYKRLGVRILAVYPPTLQGEVWENHPDWRRIGTNTTAIPEVDMKKFGHGGMLCPLGPYGDFFIDVLAEMLTKFPDIDAFSFDGLHHAGYCYCQHCRANYRKETGKEIPNPDMNDSAFRRYQHWADRRLEDLIRRMQIRLKSIKPEVALVTWSTNAGRFGHFLSIPRNMPARMNLLFDAPDQEFWLDETNRGLSILPALGCAYAWAITNHRVAFSEPYILSHGNPYGRDSFPTHEIERRMMLALTHGCMPSIAVAQPQRLQQPLYDIMDEVQKRKPWVVGRKPEKWAALLLSDNSRNFYGRSAGHVEERYMAPVLGAFRTMVEEHLPVTVINDWNLCDQDLADYKVLILPNGAALDQNQTKAIERFVANGGGLVASLETSLFDEFGDPRKNFALADLLGVDYLGLAKEAAPSTDIDVNFAKGVGPDYWEKRKNILDFRVPPESPLNKGKVADLIGLEQVTFKGPALRVKAREGTKVIGTFAPKDVPFTSFFPAITERTHGKGKAIYLAGGLDSAYYLYPYPYQRAVLSQLVQAAASGPSPVTVKAPMCVHTNLTRQTTAKGDRLVLHLFNDLNTTATHAHPAEDVPLREELVPIHNIKVQFEPRYKVTSVRLEPMGKELPIEQTAQGAQVEVPKLDVHALVVAELEK